MRVLLLTPFAPTATHDHAAADTLVHLVPRLAAHAELFVYSPQPADADGASGYTLVGSPAPARRRPGDRFGVRPAWLREAWPRAATREAADLVRRLRPDVVHGEYLQTAEALAGHRRTVLGLHDITTAVMAASHRAARGPVRAYRMAELVRTRRFERAAIRRAGAVVTLSPADHAVVAAGHRHAVLARPGVDLPDVPWRPPTVVGPPRLVFVGAMWRRANALAARFLAEEVLPLVWRDHPNVELRIVGARPGPEVVGLGRRPRVTVTGAVPDLTAELRAAHGVVAPSVLGGGVLMKVLTAMALGAPVVTTPGPARAVGGDHSTLYVGATAPAFAAAVGALLAAPAEAAGRGARAREHVARAFRWEDTVAAYLTAYATAAGR